MVQRRHFKQHEREACTFFCPHRFVQDEHQLPGLHTEGHSTNAAGLPGGPVVRNLPANAGDTGSTPGFLKDPTCLRAAKPMHHSYGALGLQALKACVPSSLCSTTKRSRCSEKPVHCNREWPLLPATRESPCTAMRTQCRQI